MIEAIIFDLDGTLVQTEILKAKSYARAAIELGNGKIEESDVIEAFKAVVGSSRKEVAEFLISHFNLMDVAQVKMEELGIMTPWQAFVQIRLHIYELMLKDPSTLEQYRCPYNIDLLKWARQNGNKTGLATMSHCLQAMRILKILKIEKDFDFIATGDDVENGKPDPQIYLLVAKELKVLPAEALVIEDSPAGAKAAPSTTERHQVLGMAGVAAHAQKAMLQATAAEVVLEFPLHVRRQRAFLLGHVGDERRVVLLDDLVEERTLGPVALVWRSATSPLGSPCRERR